MHILYNKTLCSAFAKRTKSRVAVTIPGEVTRLQVLDSRDILVPCFIHYTFSQHQNQLSLVFDPDSTWRHHPIQCTARIHSSRQLQDRMATAATQEAHVPSISSNAQTPQPSAPLDIQYYLTVGLEGIERQQYRSARSLRKAIDKLHDEFDSGNSSARQYLVFVSATQEHIEKIESLREARFKGLCTMYLKNEEVLIVKIIPNCYQEMTHLGFGHWLYSEACKMGLKWRLDFMGRTTFEGILGRKEGDSTFQPSDRRMTSNWPTVVFECGLAESLERLRVDCRGWLENSTEVNIILLFSLSQANKGIHIERWEMLPVPITRVTHPHPDSPTSKEVMKTYEIDIVAGVAAGAPGPLTFDFQQVFLRPPVQGEGDIVFSVQEMEKYAAHIWGVQ